MRDCSKFVLSMDVFLPESQVAVVTDRFEPLGPRKPDNMKLMSFFYAVSHKGEANQLAYSRTVVS